MPTLPPQYLDAVAALGFPDLEGNFVPTASAFFLGKLIPKKVDSDTNMYRIYLVTNRHVLSNLDHVAMRLNSLEGNPPLHYIIPRNDQDGLERWHFHSDANIDVAIIDLTPKMFEENKIKFSFFKEDQTYLMRDDFEYLGISEGDLVYSLGFPMGLAGESRNYTIVRSGSIARISDYLAKASNSFLIDCSIYPGNSGGPVVLRPSVAGIDKPPIIRAHLLGVVNAYIPYTDIAISVQTGMERVRFQENSNLATVHPVQYIEETILDYIKNKFPDVLEKNEPSKSSDLDTQGS